MSSLQINKFTTRRFSRLCTFLLALECVFKALCNFLRPTFSFFPNTQNECRVGWLASRTETAPVVSERMVQTRGPGNTDNSCSGLRGERRRQVCAQRPELGALAGQARSTEVGQKDGPIGSALHRGAAGPASSSLRFTARAKSLRLCLQLACFVCPFPGPSAFFSEP